jgi:hypothetical protein
MAEMNGHETWIELDIRVLDERITLHSSPLACLGVVRDILGEPVSRWTSQAAADLKTESGDLVLVKFYTDETDDEGNPIEGKNRKHYRVVVQKVEESE